MRKLKIYLDTSVISHLDAPDTPDKQADTLKLWNQINVGKYEVSISSVVFEELDKCDEPKKSIMADYLNDIKFSIIQESSETTYLAKKLIENGTLTNKRLNDCRHIACALAGDCDMIISWNFKHMVNIKTINGVKSVSVLEGYKEINIYTPSILTGGEEND